MALSCFAGIPQPVMINAQNRIKMMVRNNKQRNRNHDQKPIFKTSRHAPAPDGAREPVFNTATIQ